MLINVTENIRRDFSDVVSYDMDNSRVVITFKDGSKETIFCDTIWKAAEAITNIDKQLNGNTTNNTVFDVKIPVERIERHRRLF